ncbi:hypothetical protein XENOCAPTIV_002659 [Xenoophorus captivus]|uniref:U3 small nucleolar RNA-associated protein 20 domain-containing protein n=1 Tax=Xenoophorus captivus TaxID=1517983 RepID=A0ABV0Q492_9TELE
MNADNEDEAAVEELETSDDEQAMEIDGKAASTDVNMETDATARRENENTPEQAVTSKTAAKAAPKMIPVASGLPQSREELESLIAAIHQTVNDSVLPRLNKCLTAKVRNNLTVMELDQKTLTSSNNEHLVHYFSLQVQRDEEHKAVKSKDVKDEEVVRIPIAFAMVKLMQTLPPHIMEANLPGILIKVCVVLRNRFQEIRDVARGTLVKIIETLGCRYLQYLLREMQGVLVKGYQLLSAVSPTLKSGDLDPCMGMLIGVRTSESQIPVIDILLLCHGLVSQSLPLLTKRDRYARLNMSYLTSETTAALLTCSDTFGCLFREKASAKPPPDPRLPPPSCLLLPPTPKRGGQKAPVSSRTNMHILVDAGLKVTNPIQLSVVSDLPS